MKPHVFRYYVYDDDGRKLFDTSSLADARVWLDGERYIIRKDFLGNYPDKTIKL